MRLLLNKLPHKPNTLLILQHHDFDALSREISLPAYKRLVLADHDSRNLVQYAGASAHVAGRKRCIHRGTRVCARRQTAGVFERRDFALQQR